MPEAARIAYLTGRYPAPSHTFVLGEVENLRELGMGIDSFSIWRSKPEDLLSDADRAEQRRTFTFLPPSLGLYLKAHFAAARAGGRYLSHLADALRLAPPGARGKLLAVSWFLESIVMWQECRRRQIRHIHAHLNGTAPAVAMLATRFANCNSDQPINTWSMTVHGPSEFYDVKGEQLSAKIKDASFVVCVSDYARSQLMTLVEEEEWDKLLVVRCGVRYKNFVARPRDATSREANILSVARLAPAKGQAVLVDAIAELANQGVEARVKLIGEGPKRASLEDRIARLGLADRFELVGAVGAHRVPGFYEQADVFCLSSFAEGLPIVLMEAMAAELPVVAPRTMGIPELVRDGVNGLLVTPGRPDELAAALGRLIGDPELRIALGRAGRQTVADEFSLEQSAMQLSRLFAAKANGG
ncbi:MAG: glycosyltransferase family 4 protein [Solirubrobacterales bacterium]|nr:glycosyltransferase family 4 protein [Solirubrobacterales bacterium]